MSKKKRQADHALLESWRPPRGAGDPVGCLTTTFTFDASFFEEECLARFLEIDSLPDRETTSRATTSSSAFSTVAAFASRV